MLKYELIPGQLLHEGTAEPGDFFVPSVCSREDILLTHEAEYLHKLENQTLSEREQRAVGFPQSPQLTLREKTITQGTIDCATHAMENGVAFNVAGGTHHAFRDRGEGFCLLNDFAVAANRLLRDEKAKDILFIDLDVHQGNGTASIFRNEERVFTFSMHGAHNYPFRKEVSDLDLPLPDGIRDAEYLSLLSAHLTWILERRKPDIAFYLSGVDVLETDRFGKLKVTMAGCRERDLTVFRMLQEKGIPCAVSMGGGYSPDVKVIVEAHCQTYRAAREVYGL